MDAVPDPTKVVFLSVLLTAATVGGFVLSALAVGWWALIGVVAGGGVGYVQFDLLRKSARAKVFDFPSEQDPAFVDFFTTWYGQGGSHFVFCNDLKWLSGPELAVVLAALTKHGDRVQVFVSDDSDTACADLRTAGGLVHRVPEEIAKISVKLSLNVDNETKQIIYRKKIDTVRKNVRFLRTSDANTVALAETLIKACRQIAINNATKQSE